MTLQDGSWPRLTRVLLLTVLAGCCATVLYAQVYLQFDRVRIKVVTTERPSTQGSVVVSLPDLTRLAGIPAAIILRLENGEIARTVTISINDTEVDRVVLRPERAVRVDLNVSGRAGLTSRDRFELRSDGDGWSLHYLEIANVHGFSHGLFNFVIVPFSTNRYDYDSPSAIASLSVFGVLLVLSLALLQFGENRIIRFAQTALGTVVLILLCTTLVLAMVSKYKIGNVHEAGICG